MHHDGHGQGWRSLSTLVNDGSNCSHGTIDQPSFCPEVGSEHDTCSISHADNRLEPSCLISGSLGGIDTCVDSFDRCHWLTTGMELGNIVFHYRFFGGT